MKKLITIFEPTAILKLKDHVDGFIVGQNNVSTRLTRSFSDAEIIEASQLAKVHNKLFFITMNRILHDKDEQTYQAFLEAIDSDAVTGYFIGDIGISTIANKLNITHKMIYNPETLLANRFDVHYYHELGFQGAFLAKEITKEDVIEIGHQRPYHLFMYIHGYLNMFYSKRQLIEAYFENQGKYNLYHDERNLKVIEEKRPDLIYKILEDEAGTHIFREHVFAGVDHIDDLKDSVDYMVFDTIFHDDDYGLKVLKYYQTKDEQLKKEILNTYHETWDTGFLFKKTVYKPKKVKI